MSTLKFQIFRGAWSSFDTLFQQAATFASTIGPDNLVNISHSEDGNDGVVTVWYWSETASQNSEPKTLRRALS